MPRPEPTPAIDSDGDSTGSDASLHSLSAEKLEEKKTASHVGDRPRSFAVVAGMGFELAGATILLAGIGHLVDRYFGEDRSIGFAIGGLLGFGLGMFRFILKALQQIEKSNA